MRRVGAWSAFDSAALKNHSLARVRRTWALSGFTKLEV
jgi:hypothetical protein